MPRERFHIFSLSIKKGKDENDFYSSSAKTATRPRRRAEPPKQKRFKFAARVNRKKIHSTFYLFPTSLFQLFRTYFNYDSKKVLSFCHPKQTW